MKMPASRRRPRVRLFLLVFGSAATVAVLAGVGLIALVSAHVTSTGLAVSAAGDQGFVRTLLDSTLEQPDLTGPVTPGRAATIDATLADAVRRAGVLNLRILATDGRMLFASDGGSIAPSLDERFRSALSGAPSAALVDSGTSSGPTQVVSEYLPLVDGGRTSAVVAIERDGTALASYADAVRRDVAIAMLSAAVVLVPLLWLIFRASQGLLNRQARILLERSRRDPSTGLLNHGAIFELVAGLVDGSRRNGEPLAIAVADIDNFRLLNEVHGHATAEHALRVVAQAVSLEARSAWEIGRYGPDEFLIVAPGTTVSDLRASMDRVRERLTSVSLHVKGPEELPLTVSIGVGGFPENGTAVTELLSEVTIALGEAKAAGGDATRSADAMVDERQARGFSSFDVLQGLVIAVDTKDRYTKRHSEDVARYARFLAERIGADEKLLSTIVTAGLLHDVGKIGIPDEILRKPGPLTAYEYEAVKQHVALGDLVVRDVPNLVIVRAGVRHHHERWDGTGYLDGLAGERIPLIARVLAVADAFSAMTTTRPYRKALPVEEALRRLQDAAGTQLDPTLVRAFVHGIETVADAPMPNEQHGRTRLWRPHVRVA